MKKLITLITLIALAIPAWAGFRAFEGGSDLDIFNRINCGAGVTCSKSGADLLVAIDNPYTPAGAITGDGTAALSGMLQKQVASTSTTITAAQCGSTFVSDSADVMNLPEASTVLGCRLTFICGTADDFDINPDNADEFGPAGVITGTNTTVVIDGAAGDAYRCTDIGAGFVIEAVSASLWAVISTQGIITDVN